ncbi:MAG TPA: formylglycine-generating enzyme family protein [Crinalium sp.]|jgi:formylglycine-generating enzyme required for sulfatase activity
MERLIEILGDKLDLTAEEIADILWLGLLKWQSPSGAATLATAVTPISEEEQSSREQPMVIEDDQSAPEPSRPTEALPMAGLQAQRPSPRESTSEGIGGLPIALPDAPALRGTLALLRALKPLLRKVPSVQETRLDEAITAERIAETDLWVPELQPELEPWLDLALVVDASPSMLIWQRSLRDVQRLLRQCGAFRDVRVWSLDVNEDGTACLRPGYSIMAAQATPCSPRQLIDPNGRRLVWVMSDCIDDRWRTGAVNSALAVWAQCGILALVQVLPEWLWDRTALQSVPKVRFYGLEPGATNQTLRVKRRDRWRRSSDTDIKVPVLTLEAPVAERWSQMVAGKGSVGAAGVLFARSPQPPLNSMSLSSQERVKQFHIFSSPIARRLAGLLSACPIVSLPIIRMVQDAMLSDSDQVHMAEVLWSGLFQPIAPVENFANPDSVEYRLQDSETRQILLGETPPADTFQILSRWVNQRLGKTLDEFVAILQDPQQREDFGNQAQAFAGVTIDVLRRQGGKYTRIAERLAARWLDEPQTESEPQRKDEWSLENLAILEFETAQLIEATSDSGFPPLQTQDVEVVTIVFEDEPKDSSRSNDLQLFEFEIATLGSGWSIRKRKGQSYRWVEWLGNTLQLEMVAIPSGQFVMGSPEDESERSTAESPQREVAVSSFFMGRYPVTQSLWRFVAGLPSVYRGLEPDPSEFKGDNRPVEQVSWFDAVEFCDRLSAYTGKFYRLPTEAEWEYACRAGTTTPFHFGETITTDLANYYGTSTYNNSPKGEYRRKTTPIDHFGIANAFGLCDMHGNISEWCQDHWHNNYEGALADGSAWLADDENARRILRGGSWFTYPRNCRSAFRNYSPPDLRRNDIGFRVASIVPMTQ